MADIYRPVDGIYQCINNPANERKYVLREVEGCYPALVPIEDATCEEAAKKIAGRYPVPQLLDGNPCDGAAATERSVPKAK